MAKPDRVLSLLRTINGKLAPLGRLEKGQQELIRRMSAVEQTTAGVRITQANDARRIDRLTKRVERLERHLHLGALK